MPNVTWEWKFGPQTVISALMLLVMFGGVVGIFTSIQADIKVAQSQVMDLRDAVTKLTAVQQQEMAAEAATTARIDLILPQLQRIEESLSRQPGMRAGER